VQKYNIFNNDGLSLQQHFIFEMLSWYGRKFRKKRNYIAEEDSTLLLDLGFGANYKDGWINADFFVAPRLKFWKKYSSRKIPDLELDLRYPINFSDNKIDGVYCGHTLEHLYPKDALNLLKEIYRILKPGHWLRINVPDLEIFVQFYIGNTVAKEFEQFDSGCEAMISLAQDYGHLSLWDYKLLSKTLANVGFVNIKKVEFGLEGTDERLIKEENVRKWSTLVIEAKKPDSEIIQ